MDIWRIIAPILLETKDVDIGMYITIYHALKLEEEYQKNKSKEGGKNDIN